MGIQFAIHQQHIVALVLGRLDERILGLHIGCIQIHDLLFLIGLFPFDGLAIVLEAEILAVRVLEERKIEGPLAELFIGQHAILDKELQVVPLLFVGLALLLENLLQPVGHLLGDIGRYLFHVGVALQVTAGHVQRDIRRIDDTVQQGQEIRDDVIHVIRHEHLVAVQLDVVLFDGHPLFDLREIQHAREVERIIHVQMDVEEGFLLHRVQFPIEFHVVFFLQFRRGLGPNGFQGIDGLVAENDRNGHELAILVQQALDAALLAIFFGILVQIQGDDCAAVFFVTGAHLVFRRSVAAPFHRLRAFLPAEGFDGYLLAHHKGRVEAQAKMSDDTANLVFVFLQELAGRREGNLVDILVYLFLRHADTPIDNLERLFLLVQFHVDINCTQLAFKITGSGKCLHFLRCIHRIGHQFTQENLVVGIQELLDHRENVLGGHANLSFVHLCHICVALIFYNTYLTKTGPQGAGLTNCHYLYRKRLILIFGVFAKGSSITSTFDS